MSNFPMPLQGEFNPQLAFDNILHSISSHLLHLRKPDILPHLQKFLAHPDICALLREGVTPSAPLAPSPSAELQEIRTTLKTLTQTVASIQKALPSPNNAAHAKVQQPPKTPSKNFLAVARAKPSTHSIVVDLAHWNLAESDHPPVETICKNITNDLATSSHSAVHLIAAKWTAKGNLILTGDASTSLNVLLPAANHIAAIIGTQFAKTTPKTRANVKWSKILINGVPTGKSQSWEPYNPDECHQALLENNPAYASLTIMQKPSWVKAPSSYKANTTSSLAVAFEDPDGTKLKSIIEGRHLYAFGTRLNTKKWKQKPSTTQPSNQPPVHPPMLRSQQQPAPTPQVLPTSNPPNPPQPRQSRRMQAKPGKQG